MSERALCALVDTATGLSSIEVRTLDHDLDRLEPSAPALVNSTRFEVTTILVVSLLTAARSGRVSLVRQRLEMLIASDGQYELSAVVGALRRLSGDYGRRGHDGLVRCVTCLVETVDDGAAAMQLSLAADLAEVC